MVRKVLWIIFGAIAAISLIIKAVFVVLGMVLLVLAWLI